MYVNVLPLNPLPLIVTLAEPTACGGEIAVSDVAELTVNEFAGTPPNETVLTVERPLPSIKFVPVMVTDVPPAVVPVVVPKPPPDGLPGVPPSRSPLGAYGRAVSDPPDPDAQCECVRTWVSALHNP